MCAHALVGAKSEFSVLLILYLLFVIHNYYTITAEYKDLVLCSWQRPSVKMSCITLFELLLRVLLWNNFATTWNWRAILQLSIQYVQDISSCGSLSTAKEPRLETSCTHWIESCSIAHQFHVVSTDATMSLYEINNFAVHLERSMSLYQIMQSYVNKMPHLHSHDFNRSFRWFMLLSSVALLPQMKGIWFRKHAKSNELQAGHVECCSQHKPVRVGPCYQTFPIIL